MSYFDGLDVLAFGVDSSDNPYYQETRPNLEQPPSALPAKFDIAPVLIATVVFGGIVWLLSSFNKKEYRYDPRMDDPRFKFVPPKRPPLAHTEAYQRAKWMREELRKAARERDAKKRAAVGGGIFKKKKVTV